MSRLASTYNSRATPRYSDPRRRPVKRTSNAFEQLPADEFDDFVDSVSAKIRRALGFEDEEPAPAVNETVDQLEAEPATQCVSVATVQVAS